MVCKAKAAKNRAMPCPYYNQDKVELVESMIAHIYKKIIQVRPTWRSHLYDGAVIGANALTRSI